MAEVLAAIGIAVAVSVGTSVVTSALTPAQVLSANQLKDLSIAKNNYGQVIPQCWGTVRLAGNLLWSTNKKEIIDRDVKRRFLGPTTITRNFYYYGSFATLFALTPYRSAEKLSRLWLNGKLVFNDEATDLDSQQESAKFSTRHMRFYPGAFDQPVDSLIQSKEPVQGYDYGLPHDPTQRATALTNLGLPPDLNHLPGYQYKSYLVLERLLLEDYYNQLPTVKAEIVFNSNNTLETIVTDICTQAGIANIDTSGIAGIPVEGFYLDRVTAAGEALKLLQQAYFFDIVQSGNTLKFIHRSENRDSIFIPTEELAAHQSGQKRPPTIDFPRPNLTELPAMVEVNYLDKEDGYESATVTARSQVSGTKRRETFTFPLVLSAEEAQQIADNLLHRFYLEAIKPKQLTLSPKYSYLEVGDRLEILFENEPYTLEITKIQTGANRLLKIDTKVVEAANIANLSTPSIPIPSGGYNLPLAETQTIITQGDTTLEVMDINLIADSDEDNGVYIGAYGGENWRDCSIYYSNDDITYYFLEVLEYAGTIGTLGSNLDESSTSFSVQLDSGSLESISNQDLNSGFNKLLVGNEIIQFQTHTLNGNLEELSGLVRGLRGTESFINDHTIGERVVLLTGSAAKIKRIEVSADDIGEVRYFKAKTSQQELDEVTAIPITIQGNALKPYSPVNITATKDNLGNITISWQRRDRRDGDSTTYNNLPLSEFEEKWEVDILNTSNNVVRAKTSSQPTVTYFNSSQITDFGNIQSTIKLRIYQISATVGRGYPAKAEITPTLFQPDPVVTQIAPTTIAIGDAVTLFGTGLAQVTEVQISGYPAINLSIISDTEITFEVDPATTSNKIELFNTIPATTPVYTTTDYLSIVSSSSGSGSGFTGFETVTNNLTITDNHKGKLLIVDTDSSDITITFDYTSLTEPTNFDVHIQNDGNNKVLFVAATNNQLLAKGTELENQYDTASFYHQATGDWRGIGALGQVDLTDYMQKSTYDTDNDGFVDAVNIDLSEYMSKSVYDTDNDGFADINIDLSPYLTSTQIAADYMAKTDYVDGNDVIKLEKIPVPGFDNTIDNNVTYTLLDTDRNKEFLLNGRTKIIKIPNTATGFANGWQCLISLVGTGDVTIERASGGTSSLYFTGGSNLNHFKTQGSIVIRHLNNNVWFINGYLEQA